MTTVTNKLSTADREAEDERKALKIHAVLNATPQQIDNYIETNVTDLASAKAVLKLIAKIAILKP